MSGVSHRGIDVESLRRRLQSATGADFRRALADALGARGQALTLKGFRESKAPDGTQWKAVKRKGKPLIDTGNLRQSVVMQSSEAGFRIEVAAPYAKYQQMGTPPRQVGARSALQNSRGRFVSPKGLMVKRKGFVGMMKRGGTRVVLRTHANRGIAPRPMVPRGDADLAAVWMPEFKRTAIQVARQRLEP